MVLMWLSMAWQRFGVFIVRLTFLKTIVLCHECINLLSKVKNAQMRALKHRGGVLCEVIIAKRNAGWRYSIYMRSDASYKTKRWPYLCTLIWCLDGTIQIFCTGLPLWIIAFCFVSKWFFLFISVRIIDVLLVFER